MYSGTHKNLEALDLKAVSFIKYCAHLWLSILYKSNYLVLLGKNTLIILIKHKTLLFLKTPKPTIVYIWCSSREVEAFIFKTPGAVDFANLFIFLDH